MRTGLQPVLHLDCDFVKYRVRLERFRTKAYVIHSADENQGGVLIRMHERIGVFWGRGEPQVHSRECSSAH